MVAVILGNGKNNAGFGGLSYSLNKEKIGKGQLMKMENFPTHLTKYSKDYELRNHLIMNCNINRNENRKPIKNPQLHAVISSDGTKNSKEELTEVAEKWLKEMGYGEQPYVIVNHNDSNNNHVHIVTSRVDISSGKKINDSNERYKSIDSLNRILGRTKQIKEQQKILDYNFKTLGQVKVVLDKYKIPYSENEKEILAKWGAKNFTFKNEDLDKTKENFKRKLQIKAILHNYKNKFDNNIFKISGSKIEYQSQLKEELKAKLGLEIIFHTKDDKKPFGYSLIDHKTKEIFKGSEILKMKEFCNFTENRITKNYYEELINLKFDSLNSAKIVLKNKPFMLPLSNINKNIIPKEHLKEWVNYNNCNAFMKDYNCQVLNQGKRTIIKNNYSKQVTDVTYDKDFNGLRDFKETNRHKEVELLLDDEPISLKNDYELDIVLRQFSNIFIDSSNDIPLKKKKKRKIKR